MKGWKGSALTIMVLLILFCFSAVPVATAAKAKIVSEAEGLQNYVPSDNNFARGDTLKVYTEMSDVNYEGFVFVEFVFIIKDPKGNVVSMDRMSVERRNYDESAYVVYSKAIPTWWLYGNYKLRIYAYNRINKVKIVELERKMDNPNRVDELGFYDSEVVGKCHQIGWSVPAVPTKDGSFWGYTSVPQSGVDWWSSLPLRK